MPQVVLSVRHLRGFREPAADYPARRRLHRP